MTGIGR